MGQELAGKVAVVTGGVKGIGLAIVEVFLEEGAKVVAIDVDEAGGEELARVLGPGFRFKRGDVASEADIEAAVAFTVAEFGRLDAWVNNAGFPSQIAANALDLDLSDFDKVMNINLKGVMLGSVLAARQMAKNGGGSIINISSVAGVRAGPGPLSYRAAKAGSQHFGQCLAIDLAQFNIRVNTIAPYNVITTIVRNLVDTQKHDVGEEQFQELDQVYRKGMMASQPLKRQAQARDVANAAVFYASDRSLQVTGTLLPVDGGYTAGDAFGNAPVIAAAHDKVTAGN